jgi:hypothetical protein
MKARLLALVVDLLLDCFTLLIGPDKSPGIAVSTIPELAAALVKFQQRYVKSHTNLTC